jgi:hypothetical protein
VVELNGAVGKSHDRHVLGGTNGGMEKTKRRCLIIDMRNGSVMESANGRLYLRKTMYSTRTEVLRLLLFMYFPDLQ